MKLALSTNWFAGLHLSGEAIADKAIELGFDGLELGFRTHSSQLEGFRSRLDKLPVGSIHSFCPIPISAPNGNPELYSLVTKNEDALKLAQIHITRNIRLAAEFGADALVMHAGRLDCRGLFTGPNMKRRKSRGKKAIDLFKRGLEALVPELEKNKVTLGLENLPYIGGFPGEWELSQVCGDWVRGWFDTGHDHVRKLNGWKDEGETPYRDYMGVHLNDSKGGDDHLAPGDGDVDFISLMPCFEKATHFVMEPNGAVTEEDIVRGIKYIRNLWN